MKTRYFVSIAILAAVSGCKKNEPAPSGAASTGVEQAPSALASALKDFEGEITVHVHSAKRTKDDATFVATVKAPKLRFQIPEGLGDDARFKGGGYAVVNAPEKQLLVVMEAQKQVMVLDLAQLGDQLKGFHGTRAPAGQPASGEAPPKITKTGHTDTVAGQSCEDWDVSTAKGEKTRICVTNEDASWFQLPGTGFSGEQAWARELADGHHLPMRVITFDPSGAEDGRMEVTKIEKKTIPDSAFEVPAGYRRLDLGAMMRGLFAGGLGAAAAGSAGLPPGVSAGTQLPPGMQLPPNMKLPPGMQLPPNMKLPPEAAAMMQQMQERARAAAAAAGQKP